MHTRRRIQRSQSRSGMGGRRRLHLLALAFVGTAAAPAWAAATRGCWRRSATPTTGVSSMPSSSKGSPRPSFGTAKCSCPPTWPWWPASPMWIWRGGSSPSPAASSPSPTWPAISPTALSAVPPCRWCAGTLRWAWRCIRTCPCPREHGQRSGSGFRVVGRQPRRHERAVRRLADQVGDCAFAATAMDAAAHGSL